MRIAGIVVLLSATLAVTAIAAYKAGETAAYKEQGKQARQDGRPMTAWPYEDWNGSKFEWVVGWHIENGKAR